MPDTNSNNFTYPLSDFYARAKLPLPRIETIPADAVPEPFRALLVHNNDMTPTAEERYLREFMLQLKLGSVSAEKFAKKFGIDPREQFAAPLATLKKWGFLTNGGDRIGVTREGLLKIDQLLHEFFKPEHKTGRYA